MTLTTVKLLLPHLSELLAVVFLVINGMLDVLWYHLKGIRDGKLEK